LTGGAGGSSTPGPSFSFVSSEKTITLPSHTPRPHNGYLFDIRSKQEYHYVYSYKIRN
jgi:hypothetical protein